MRGAPGFSGAAGIDRCQSTTHSGTADEHPKSRNPLNPIDARSGRGRRFERSWSSEDRVRRPSALKSAGMRLHTASSSTTDQSRQHASRSSQHGLASRRRILRCRLHRHRYCDDSGIGAYSDAGPATTNSCRFCRIREHHPLSLSQLETADRHGEAAPEAKVERLKGKIEKLKEEIEEPNSITP